VNNNDIDTSAPPLRIHDADSDLAPGVERFLIGEGHGPPSEQLRPKPAIEKGQDLSPRTIYEILDQNTIRINAVDILPSAEFTRDGNIYSGTVVLTDGEPLTSWPDYQRWFLMINFTNDSDSDGIPDISDSADTVELKAMPWIPLLLLIE
jgi:hypothetical protein